MINIIKQGNLLEANVEALVNPINCVGVVSKGLALQFKNTFPENFKAYQRACKYHYIRLGWMFIFDTHTHTHTHSFPKYIINFPTKYHWRNQSQIEDIANGLNDLVEIIYRRRISSIAIPALGCDVDDLDDLDGLDWTEVQPLIESACAACAELDNVQVSLFEPGR